MRGGPCPAALADELRASEDKQEETESQVKRDTLGALRALEKELRDTDWMYEAPRHSHH